jgi:hypothetical protein
VFQWGKIRQDYQREGRQAFFNQQFVSIAARFFRNMFFFGSELIPEPFQDITPVRLKATVAYIPGAAWS